jgi:hypothetical protein
MGEFSWSFLLYSEFRFPFFDCIVSAKSFPGVSRFSYALNSWKWYTACSNQSDVSRSFLDQSRTAKNPFSLNLWVINADPPFPPKSLEILIPLSDFPLL